MREVHVDAVEHTLDARRILAQDLHRDLVELGVACRQTRGLRIQVDARHHGAPLGALDRLGADAPEHVEHAFAGARQGRYAFPL